ncbi:IS1634 family transposase [Jonesiaceae bacterium BS-20]|uniref:IS1634 family transposase n=1 Tax=Jonesiaceae bacterium BS-20 TaxID=3120821 RepID=A0AAU7E1F2_9MICO
MSPFLRKKKLPSGATSVQVIDKSGGKYRVIKHVGSGRSETEIAALMQVGAEYLLPGQQELDLDFGHVAVPDPGRAVVQGSASQLLTDVIAGAYNALGFDVLEDDAFFQLVLARLVEPTSKSDSVRVVEELGLQAAHLSTFKRALIRCAQRDYRAVVASKCFDYSLKTSGLSLLLYDVTTLYFEAENEDDLRKVGFSKERRVDPQIVVGLLVDRTGFPLEIHAFPGNKAETQTIIPVVKAFQERNQVTDMVVVADAGMLSAGNLDALNDAGLRFIVGSRMAKAPEDLAKHFHHQGTVPNDGDLVDTVTMRRGRPNPDRLSTAQEPVWAPGTDMKQWRAVWQYRHKRAVRDHHTLGLQRDRAQNIIDGNKPAKSARFVQTKGGQKAFDQASFDRAYDMAGWKGYVTNIPAHLMPATEVVSSYHDLWQVEQSFRMSKTDLRARPIFHHTKDAIEAHLTIVFTALAIARYLQTRTGITIKALVKLLRPLRQVTISISGHDLIADPQIPKTAQEIQTKLKTP